ARHAEDAAVEEDVFAAGEFGVEAGADFEEAADAAAQFDAAGGRLDNPSEYLEQRAFTGAVLADDADRFSGRHVEGDIFKGPEVVVAHFPVGIAAGDAVEEAARRPGQRFGQRGESAARTAAEPVLLGNTQGSNRKTHGLRTSRSPLGHLTTRQSLLILSFQTVSLI